MEKRTILAFVLMALVLIVSQYVLSPPSPSEDEARSGEARQEKADSRASAGRDTAPTARPASVPQGTESSVDRTYAAPPGPSIAVETPLYGLTLSRRGALVTRIYLKKYPSFRDSLPAQIVPDRLAFLQRTIRAGDRTIDLTDVDFVADRPALHVDARVDSLVLTGRTPDGEQLRQIYHFDPETYLIDYRLEVPAPGGRELVTRLGPQLRSNEVNVEEDLKTFAAVLKVGGDVRTLRPDDVEEGAVAFPKAVEWVGIKSKYFLAVLVSDREPFAKVQLEGVTVDTLPGIEIAAVEALRGGSASYRIYLGPQEFRGLAKVGLEDVNQYGWSWVRWLVQPFAHLIIRILLWMHQYVPNYGVVLIIFGILVRILLWPLTQKSFDSMQKMQAVQPELQRFRERYKNDPQKMQAEMMRLYRERGVNPLGGCLPNLIPLPVLFALFFVFQNTIEFRGAPFVGWIQDLSRPDPYYVLPILMGVTMFIQQKLTTPPDNPQMKMMMYVMPIFLTFIFLNLASGLVLYYTVSNVLTFLQQILMKRKAPSAEPPAASAPAEAKPSGGERRPKSKRSSKRSAR